MEASFRITFFYLKRDFDLNLAFYSFHQNNE